MRTSPPKALWPRRMAKPRLHLDADTSKKSLHQALLARGHDVTRTPNEWMPLDAADETQWLGATRQQRCLFTYNIRDFVPLARRIPQHGGMLDSLSLPGESFWIYRVSEPSAFFFIPGSMGELMR